MEHNQSLDLRQFKKIALGEDGSLKFSLGFYLGREVRLIREIKPLYRPRFVPKGCNLIRNQFGTLKQRRRGILGKLLNLRQGSLERSRCSLERPSFFLEVQMMARARRSLGRAMKVLSRVHSSDHEGSLERNAYCLPEKDWLERRIDVA